MFFFNFFCLEIIAVVFHGSRRITCVLLLNTVSYRRLAKMERRQNVFFKNEELIFKFDSQPYLEGCL